MLGGDQRVDPAIEAIVVIGDEASGVQIVEHLRSLEASVPVIGTDRWASDAFAASIGDAPQVRIATQHTWALPTAEAIAWWRALGDPDPPCDAAIATAEALSLVAAAVAAGAVDAEGITAFLSQRRHPDSAIEGPWGPLAFDEDGAMLRDPWVLTPRSTSLIPAHAQLRPGVDRQLRRTDVVLVGLDVLDVDALDPEAGRFEASLQLWLRWQGAVDVDGLRFLDAIGEPERTTLRQHRLGDGSHHVVYSVDGAFRSPMDLSGFPLDEQGLRLRLAHPTLTSDALLLAVDRAHLSDAPRPAPRPWRWRSPRDHAARAIPTTTSGDPRWRWSTSEVHAELRLARDPSPILSAVGLPLVLLWGLGWIGLVTPRSQPTVRVGLPLGALIGLVLLQQGAPIPAAIPTRLDRVFSIAQLSLAAIVAAGPTSHLVSPWVGPRALRWLERAFAAGLALAVGIALSRALPAPVLSELGSVLSGGVP